MSQEFRALNGLRFPACVLIFLQHLPAWAYPDAGWARNWAQPLAEQAHAAMPYFFVLSGFVLAHVYRQTVLRGGKLAGLGVGRFLLRRAIRLFPLHWLGLMLALPLALMAGNVSANALIAHLTLTQALIPDIAIVASFNIPSWSLSAELVFAFLFPVLVLWLARGGARLRLFLLALCLMAPIGAAAAMVAADRTGFLALYIHPFARAADFTAGILLYLLWKDFRWKLDGLAWEIGPIALLAGAMALSPALPLPFRFVALFLPAGVLLTMVFIDGDGPLRRALSRPAALWFGRLAFAFYIVHFIVIRYVERTRLSQLAGDDNLRWFVIPLLFLLSLLAAVAIHYAVERQVEPRLQRWLTRQIPAAS